LWKLLRGGGGIDGIWGGELMIDNTNLMETHCSSERKKKEASRSLRSLEKENDYSYSNGGKKGEFIF